MLTNSESFSDEELCELALVYAQNGGLDRASAVLALPLKRLRDAYSAMSPEARETPGVFENHRLADTVPAILDDIAVPKYRRL
jgi:hypothetical protein